MTDPDNRMKNSPFPVIEYSLQQARVAIAAQICPLEPEKIPVFQALGHITAEPIYAVRPKPFYSQSTRDGFALAARPAAENAAFAEFQVIGEIPAGCTEHRQVQAGQAYRIMTGAMIPSGCVRVVPFEVCREKGGSVLIPTAELSRHGGYIRQQGRDIREGQLLVAAGIRLQPDHLLLLAENGAQEIMVSRQPGVAVICTGSELVRSEGALQPGRKISGNEILLSSLLEVRGCHCLRTAAVEDETKTAVRLIEDILGRDTPDMLLTTGGMGPGKFDLMEQVVARLGGKPVYTRLAVRPGKSTLFAMIGTTPLFALPGPPPAVRLLFHELVMPGLQRLQGLPEEEVFSESLADAVLTAPVRFRRNTPLSLKGAMAELRKGRLQVRPAEQGEPANAILHLDCAGKEDGGYAALEKGQQVRIRLVGPLFGAACAFCCSC
ncbi:MAG: molybdopterin molybdotransferase MoeA [Candidatus Electrothrix sp. YB6]